MVVSAVSMVHTVAQRTLKLAAYLPKHTGRFAGMAERFYNHIVPFLEAAGMKYGWVRSVRFIKEFATEWAITASFIEVVRLAHPIRDIAAGQFWNGTTPENMERTIGTVANLCATALFLEELEVIELAQLSEAIGNTKIFNVLTKYPLANIALGLGSAAHVVSVYNTYNAWKADQGQSPNKLHEKRLNLAGAVSDVALDALLLAGTTSVPLLACVGGGLVLPIGLATTDHKKGK